MTDPPQPSRPQQVTTAVVLSVAACVLVVVNLFTTRDELRGTSLRDTIAQAQDGVGGLGQDGQAVLRVLETLVFVSGALAATAAVLAVYVWQRNRAAWIGFFVVAALLALTLPVAGVLPVLLLASGATFMASRPARDWFADRAPAAGRPQVVWAQEGPRGVEEPPGGHHPPPPWPGAFGGGGSSAAPHGPPPQGAADAAAAGAPAPTYGPWQGAPQGQPPAPYPGTARDPEKRPGTVTAACVVTWVGATLVALLTGLVALVLAADRDAFVREFQQQAGVADVQVTADQVLAIAWTMAAVGLVWCLVAVVLAVLAFRRSRGGRVALAVSAGLTVLVSLLLVLSIVAVVPLLMGIAVLVLLFTGGANDWYARRVPHSGPPPGGGPYGGQQYPQPQPPPPPGRSGPW